MDWERSDREAVKLHWGQKGCDMAWLQSTQRGLWMAVWYWPAFPAYCPSVWMTGPLKSMPCCRRGFVFYVKANNLKRCSTRWCINALIFSASGSLSDCLTEREIIRGISEEWKGHLNTWEIYFTVDFVLEFIRDENILWRWWIVVQCRNLKWQNSFKLYKRNTEIQGHTYFSKMIRSTSHIFRLLELIKIS